MSKLIFQNDEEKELWKQVAAGVASSSNATDKYSMYSWADRAVEYFRERNIIDKLLYRELIVMVSSFLILIYLF